LIKYLFFTLTCICSSFGLFRLLILFTKLVRST
jgi:hypothetical protein